MNGQQWYVAVAGQQQGPMSAADVISRVRAGQLDRSAHVFTQGMASWEPIASRPEFAAAFAAPSGAGFVPPGPPPAAAGPVAHEIDYQIFGQEMQFVEITLDPGEACIAEAGSFMYMDPGIQMETIFGDGSAQSAGGGGFMGKLMQAGKRVLTGESLFMTVFGNTAGTRQKVAFASPYPGSIVPLDLRQLGGSMLCQKDGFLCAAKGIAVGIAFQRKLGAGLFGGEGFILQRIGGNGTAFIHGGGNFIEFDLVAGQTLRVDTGCIVAFEETVHYDIQFVGGFKNALFGGEGLFLATLSGPGKCVLQTLPFSRLAGRIMGLTREGTGGVAGVGGTLRDIGNIFGGSE